MRDFPVTEFSIRDAHERIQHVLLTNIERRDINEAILIMRQTGAPIIILIIRQYLQPQQTGNTATALGQRARIDARVPIVEEGDGALAEVEAVEMRTGREAVLVPEAAGDADPGAPAEAAHVLAEGGVFLANGDVVEEARVGAVVAVLVGEDPGDVGGGGGFDEPHLRLGRGSGAHGDDEGFLAPEGLDEGFLVVVVDFFDLHAGWYGACARAVCAGDGGDFVFSDLQ